MIEPVCDPYVPKLQSVYLYLDLYGPEKNVNPFPKTPF